jgi:hypothetical protein
MMCLLFDQPLRDVLSLETSLNYLPEMRCDLCHKGGHFSAQAPLDLHSNEPFTDTVCLKALPAKRLLSANALQYGLPRSTN